jgi:diguanylate cyclase (GGDEF)-like protein
VSTRSDERLAGLVRLARVLSEARSLLDLAERAAEEGRFAFGARSVSLSRLEPEHGRVRTLVNAGELAEGEERFPADDTHEVAAFPLLVAMVDELRPWRVDVGDPSADRAEREFLRSLGAASGLAAPVLAAGRVWGELFAIRSAQDEPFDDDDLAYATAFAGLISAGLGQIEHLELVQRLAYHDPLTGLGNRRLVEEELDAALAAGAGPVAVVMADVNRLKQANDEHGHEAGDRALVAIAHALSAACGSVPNAVAGRVGGDEFCAVLPGQGAAAGEALASAFMRGTRDAPFGVSVSCGVASTEGWEGPLSRERLFALADSAQYDAKRARARHPVVASGDAAATAERRALRGRAGEPDPLSLALSALASARGRAAEERLALGLAAVASGAPESSWVLSRIGGGAALPVRWGPVDADAFLASVPAPEGAPWLEAARAHGVVVRADDEVPLAAVRGYDRVVVAAAGPWLAEVCCRTAPPADLPAVLRAVLGVALSG